MRRLLKTNHEVKGKDFEAGDPRVGFDRLMEAVAGEYGCVSGLVWGLAF